MLAILIFLVFLSFLVFLHEFGHFLIAKKKGIKVEEFGFGYPPRLFAFKKGETLYSFNLLPFGGFVKIFGAEEEKREDPKSFTSQKPKTKFLVLIAGILMNLIFGLIVLSIGYYFGLPTLVTPQNLPQLKEFQLSILDVAVDSPAQKVGLKAGDVILKIQKNGDSLEKPTVSNLQQFSKKYPNQNITLFIKRGEKFFEKEIFVRENPPSGQGALGLVVGETGFLRYPLGKNFYYGFRDGLKAFFNIFIFLYFFLKSLILKGETFGTVVGPVGIINLGSQAWQLGWGYFLQFLAILSIHLAALNFLPFPALDGSRLFFVLLEKIRGRPVSFKFENFTHSLGFIFLIFLMILITFRDLARLF